MVNLFLILVSLEKLLPIATRVLRSYNSDCMTSTSASGTLGALSFRRSLLEFTLSKALETSEQYTAIFALLAK